MNFRPVIAVLLALMLSLTSQAMAIARIATDATGQMVICVGDGTMTIYTDAEGEPTSAPHICPDCALHLAFLPDAAVVSGLFAVFPTEVIVGEKDFVHGAKRRLLPQNRAPPALI